MTGLRHVCCLWAGLVMAGCAGPGGLSLPALTGGGRPSDLALADLARGDFTAAESHALAAVQEEPGNPYALLAAAVVYENSGRPELARRYYETLATLQPPATATIGLAPQPSRPVGDIAVAGYRRLSAPPAASAVPPPAAASPEPPPPARDDALASRFDILSRLLSAGLIADGEYRERRAANLGGLMPYSAPMPPSRLLRPPPPAEQFVQRLQALARNFEMRAVGAGEYAAERAAILDGLLPAAVATGDAPPPPRDELAMAAAVGRLQRLQAANLLSAEEVTRERRAMEAAWAPAPAVTAAPLPGTTPPVPAESAAAAPRKLTPTRASTDAGPSVHLASLKGERQAWDEWAALQARFPALKGLSARIVRVDLGKGKGIVHRLVAGPLGDRAAADRLCRTLRDKRQYCAPTT